jgi:Leucine-rich repeat (LRR) protein
MLVLVLLMSERCFSCACHATGLYREPTRTERMMGQFRGLFAAKTGTNNAEFDASAAGDDIYGGMDYSYNQTDKRRSVVSSTCREIWQDRRKRSLVYLVIATFIFIVAIVSLKRQMFPSPKILRQQNNARFSAGMDHIIRKGVSHADTFTDYDSAQYHALRWISYSDPAQVAVDDDIYLTRYALATFFYSCFLTFEKRAGKQKPIEDGKRQWEGVPNPGWTRHDHWLTEKGVCQWYGVHCSKKHVTNPDTGEAKFITQYDANEAPIGLLLRQNHVVGKLPQEFKALEGLIDLDLGGNMLSGAFPAYLGRLYNLKYLHLPSNHLSGSLPSEIGLLEKLKRLDLRHNKITGAIPSQLNHLYNLEILELDHNELTGQIPYLTSCHNLTIIHLENNKLGDAFPFSFALLRPLKELYLQSNRIIGSLPAEIESVRGLEVIHMEDNLLTGSIPHGMFGKMSHLKVVALANNKLDGTFPTDTHGMVQLEVLALNNNNITGTIVESWGSISTLQKLHLNDNDISGMIPESFGKLVNLKDLWLSSNRMTGPITYELGKCTSLQNLFLEGNQLTGGIPTELGQLTALETFRLHDNKVQGQIPFEVCDLKSDNILKFLSSDCKSNTAVTCDCCDQCN